MCMISNTDKYIQGVQGNQAHQGSDIIMSPPPGLRSFLFTFSTIIMSTRWVLARAMCIHIKYNHRGSQGHHAYQGSDD